MCLLAVLFQHHPDHPLVVAANRDEFLARPASGPQVLRADEPRVVGGRDELAGGTWLAVNRAGVVAGLTNQPLGSGPDGARRSRGELPLLLAGAASAEAAARALVEQVRCEDYNPCWLLFGDARHLYYAPIEGAGPPEVEPLAPGAHVLENRPLRAGSAKALAAARALGGAAAARGEGLLEELATFLADHDPAPGGEGGRPRELEARCVHAGPYGTRSASVVLVASEAAPRLFAAEGPPCREALTERGALWG